MITYLRELVYLSAQLEAFHARRETENAKEKWRERERERE